MFAKTKNLIQEIGLMSLVLTVAFIGFLGFSLANGWAEPTVAPPGGNLGAPINTGNSGQSKVGGLILNTGGAANGLIVQAGNVGIGTTTPNIAKGANGNVDANDVYLRGVGKWASEVDGGTYVTSGLYGYCRELNGAVYGAVKFPAKSVLGGGSTHCECESGYTTVRTGAEYVSQDGGNSNFYACYKN